MNLHFPLVPFDVGFGLVAMEIIQVENDRSILWLLVSQVQPLKSFSSFPVFFFFTMEGDKEDSIPVFKWSRCGENIKISADSFSALRNTSPRKWSHVYFSFGPH